MQDRFTKWVELCPLRKTTSQAVATAIKDQVCLRHGSPRIIVSDNGRQFIGKEVTRLCSEFHIQQRLTSTYTPQCNPVERVNRVIKTMIAQNIERSQRTWDSCLAELQFAYNTATSASTGHIPAYLNTGRELHSPGSLAHETVLPGQERHQNRIKKLHAALDLARTQMAKSFQTRQKHYNLRRRKWAPEIGEKVLKRTHHLSSKIDNFNAKLAERYEGPFTVTKRIIGVIFDLRDERGNMIHTHRFTFFLSYIFTLSIFNHTYFSPLTLRQ